MEVVNLDSEKAHLRALREVGHDPLGFRVEVPSHVEKHECPIGQTCRETDLEDLGVERFTSDVLQTTLHSVDKRLRQRVARARSLEFVVALAPQRTSIVENLR